MTDTEYLDRAEALLLRIELGCDRINAETDADIDCQRAGSMLTLTAKSGAQIVVNLQKPLHEVWLASPSQAHHYRYEGKESKEQWLDTRTGQEFFDALTQAVREEVGQMPADALDTARLNF